MGRAEAMRGHDSRLYMPRYAVCTRHVMVVEFLQIVYNETLVIGRMIRMIY